MLLRSPLTISKCPAEVLSGSHLNSVSNKLHPVCSHELEPQYSGQTVGTALQNNQSKPNSQFQR